MTKRFLIVIISCFWESRILDLYFALCNELNEVMKDALKKAQEERRAQEAVLVLDHQWKAPPGCTG